MSLIKEQVLDLQDKFDYFILSMMQNGSIKPSGDDGNDSVQQDKSLGPENDHSMLHDYQKTAYMKDLGGRQRHREVFSSAKEEDRRDRRKS